jgi:hypothetical protein
MCAQQRKSAAEIIANGQKSNTFRRGLPSEYADRDVGTFA